GYIQLFFTSPGSVMPMIEAKRLKVLAVANAERLQEYPDLPTFAEVGFPEVEANGLYGVLAPAGTPNHIIDILNKGVTESLQDPELRKQFVDRGFVAVSTSPEGFRELLKSDM